MNKTVQIGYLTKNVEMRKDKNGNDVAKFRIAVSRGKTKEGTDLGADFLNVTVFGNMAKNCYKYLGKGARVCVSGRLHSGSYVSKRNDQTVFSVEIIADEVVFLSFKEKNENEWDEPVGNLQEEQSYSEDEDLPFDTLAEE